MRNIRLKVSLIALFCLAGCTGRPDGIEPVTSFDISRYAGTWHEIMRLDHSFERGLTNVTATYELRDDGTVGVLNRGFDREKCAWEEAEGTARFQGDKTVASLSVTFFWPFAGGYHVFELDPENYTYAVVSGRHIYRRYADLGSVRLLKEELERDGIVSKARVDKYGRQTGGKLLARGALYLMLQNPIYRGRIVHKESSYPGEHKAIIDVALWDKVQQRLAANRIERREGAGARELSLLTGLIYDDNGERMIPNHANKQGRRYRYYVSKPLTTAGRQSAPRGRRVPARDVEALVEDTVLKFLDNEAEIFGAIENLLADANQCRDLIVRAAKLAARWPTLAPGIRRRMLRHLVDRIDLLPEKLEIRIILSQLPTVLSDEVNLHNAQNASAEEPMMTLTVSARLKRAGRETKYLIEGAGGGRPGVPDRSLVRLLAQAHRYRAMIMRGDGKKIIELAEDAGVGRSYFSRVLRLSFLSPEITTMILRGQQPLELTANRLAHNTNMPAVWEEQRAHYTC